MPRHGTKYAIFALIHKRARLAGEEIELQNKITAIKQAIAAVDATILLFDPKADPKTITTVRPMRRCRWFKHGEQRKLCIDAMRNAKKPITTHDIIQYAANIKGIDAEGSPLWRLFNSSTRRVLRRLEERGIVRRVMADPNPMWELSA